MSEDNVTISDLIEKNIVLNMQLAGIHFTLTTKQIRSLFFGTMIISILSLGSVLYAIAITTNVIVAEIKSIENKLEKINKRLDGV